MRILLVTESLVLGGAETFVLRLARRLRQDGHVADVLCLNPDFADPRLVGQFPDVPIHRLPSRGLRTIKRLDRIGRILRIDLQLQQRRSARWIERHLRARFDIVHTHLFGADWLFTRIKRRNPALRLVATLHGDYALYEELATGSERTRVLDWARKRDETLAAVDRWVTISRAQHCQFEHLFGVSPDKLADIPNGYAPPAPVPPAVRPVGTPITFVMVARGMREKGWGFLIEAFLRLDGDCRMVLVGEGGFLEQLRREIGDHPRIHFAGVHLNPVELIGQCDVFVHPSIYKAESLPTVIVEALFAGVPVIATDVGEVRSMIATPSGERAGTMIAPDEVTLTDDLTAAMQAYLDDSALRGRHAALAPAAFAKFDMGVCAAAYARLYAEVAGVASSNSSIKASH